MICENGRSAAAAGYRGAPGSPSIIMLALSTCKTPSCRLQTLHNMHQLVKHSICHKTRHCTSLARSCQTYTAGGNLTAGTLLHRAMALPAFVANPADALCRRSTSSSS